MTCRPATCVRECDPQHPVSSPKIHRRSPIYSSLPSHRCTAVSTRIIDDRFLPGRRELGAGGRYVHSGSHARRARGATISSTAVASLCVRERRAACPFFSVGKAGKTATATARWCISRAGKTPAEIIFYHTPSRRREHVPRFTAIYIYSKFVASSQWRREH